MIAKTKQKSTDVILFLDFGMRESEIKSKIDVFRFMTPVFPRSTKRFHLTINSVYSVNVNNAKEIQFSHLILYILQSD